MADANPASSRVVSHRGYPLELLAQRGRVVLNVLMSPEVGDDEAARTPCLDHIQMLPRKR